MQTADEFLVTLRSFFPGHAYAKEEAREGAEGLWSLTSLSGENPPWALYCKSDMDLDTDGPDNPNRKIRWESTHQGETSLRWPGGMSVSSDLVAYVVIPGGWGHGIKLGDVCLCQYGASVVPAIVADTGPGRKLGEGSIALHRALGFERVSVIGKIIDVSIEAGVRTIFFPGTGEGHCLPMVDVAARAWSAWANLTKKDGG